MGQWFSDSGVVAVEEEVADPGGVLSRLPPAAAGWDQDPVATVVSRHHPCFVV